MMDARVSHAIAFLAGAAISGLSAWFATKKVCEKKYAKIAQEEIDSVKERFTAPKVEAAKKFIEEKKNQELKKTTEQAKKATNKPSLSEYAKNIKTYVNYSDSESKEEIGSNGLKRISFKPNGNIVVIEPEAYGEDEDYDQAELTLYADGILADEDNEIIENVDDVIGVGNLRRIGEYEEDALHIKNEPRKCYYEILKDVKKYEDATGKKLPESFKDYDLYKRLEEYKDDSEEE
jgi:hypothetical protein